MYIIVKNVDKVMETVNWDILYTAVVNYEIVKLNSMYCLL